MVLIVPSREVQPAEVLATMREICISERGIKQWLDGLAASGVPLPWPRAACTTVLVPGWCGFGSVHAGTYRAVRGVLGN